jgi:predicted GNAT family acetyltransferase
MESDIHCEPGRVYITAPGGAVAAQVLFEDSGEGRVTVKSTYVDKSLRGRGVAGRLMEAAAQQIRAQNKKAVPACSYAARWFAAHPEYGDILA